MQNFFYLVITAIAISVLQYFKAFHIAYCLIRRDFDTIRSIGRLLIIRLRWGHLARQLNLVLRDKKLVSRSDEVAKYHAKVEVPRIRIKADKFGVIINLKTVPGVGLKEIQSASNHLADAWKSVRVSVTQIKPGKIRIRAVRLDPLVLPTSIDVAPEAPKDVRQVEIGMDEYAALVTLRLAGISGVGVYGMPGFGKTSFILGLIVKLAKLGCVQFVGLDGKSDEPEHGDYADLIDRFAIIAGDDIATANRILRTMAEYRSSRAASIRTLLGVTDMWKKGPSVDWPLIVLIIDEAHSYFSKVADGGDKALKERNAMAAQNAGYVEDLVKKGRSVGIITILMTQKGTSDAIPTSIRDNLGVSLCFAVKTLDGAIAALGEDIRAYPEASPVALQDAQYIGVATMKSQGQPGFTRVRIPQVRTELAAEVTQETAHLVPTRGELPDPFGTIEAIGS